MDNAAPDTARRRGPAPARPWWTCLRRIPRQGPRRRSSRSARPRSVPFLAGYCLGHRLGVAAGLCHQSFLLAVPVRIGRAGGVHRAIGRSSSVRKAVCPRWRPREGNDHVHPQRSGEGNARRQTASRGAASPARPGICCPSCGKPGQPGSPARVPARPARAPPGRGLLGGTVQYTMTARTGPSTGRALGGRSVDAGSWAVREHAPHSLRLREARFR